MNDIEKLEELEKAYQNYREAMIEITIGLALMQVAMESVSKIIKLDPKNKTEGYRVPRPRESGPPTGGGLPKKNR